MLEFESKLTELVTLENANQADAMEVFNGFRQIAETVKAYAGEAMGLVVTDRTETAKIERAKELRKIFKEGNKSLNEHHKIIKADVLAKTKIIDGGRRTIEREFFEPILAHLNTQADFVKILEEKERAERTASRTAVIAEITTDDHSADIATLKDEAFEELVGRLKAQKAEREELERLRIQAEEEKRRADALEIQKLEEENRRLRQEREASEAREREERRQREESERKAREEREAAERERQAAIAAEEAKKREEEAAKRRLEMAGEAEKREAYFAAILAIETPYFVGLDEFHTKLKAAMEETRKAADSGCPF